jgi:hypothetical protein
MVTANEATPLKPALARSSVVRSFFAMARNAAPVISPGHQTVASDACSGAARSELPAAIRRQ